ncbi:hypothetical protein [Nonomuraea fuscirosea]|uniref:hypothetical protein n=1 Tax=Nonomuraea fuscirosea TaxID=1291556 RepID=UPI0011B1D9F5|nr:hypothetical protein [Nonomuraea fuscirosea]
MTDFPFYRSLCDRENTGFRRLGLLAEAQYAAAIQDTRTVLVPVDDQMVPALCPIEYATGYDARRTRELTAQEDVFLLSLPPAYLRGQRKGTLPTQYAVLVENDHHDTDHLKKELTEHFPGAVTCDFPDPRARGSAASLTAYSAILHRNPTPRAPAEANATILNATSLRADPHLTDQLWALYGERFDWLGKHHPLSMEESQSTFNAALFHRDTQTLVTFEQGRPVCIGLFMSSLAACDWLSPAFRASLEEQTAAANENLIYFYASQAAQKPQRRTPRWSWPPSPKRSGGRKSHAASSSKRPTCPAATFPAWSESGSMKAGTAPSPRERPSKHSPRSTSGTSKPPFDHPPRPVAQAQAWGGQASEEPGSHSADR